MKKPDLARTWKGLRQDSGDPFAFAPLAKKAYESMGIDHREKSIIYSDALNLDKALGLKKQCDELGFPCASVTLPQTNRRDIYVKDTQS